MGIFTSPQTEVAAPSVRRAQGEWTHPAWRCSSCGTDVPPRSPLPFECPKCGAQRELFVLVDQE